jgi:very-short-patch-repair endonuclease
VLRAGPGAVLSHETAAEIHGLIDKPSSRIHVTVSAERRPGQHRKIPGVVIHRSRRLMAEWQPPWHLPRTSVEDTVLDLVAAARSFDDAYGWISRAVGRRLTSPRELSKALSQRSRIRWRAWLTGALEDAADGVHSPLERNYVDGVERAHGLPKARRQARRRHGSGTRYLDNLYEKYSLSVELDGQAAHPAEERWRDTHRDNANRVQGTETMRYGWPDVTENRCRTAAEVGAVLRRRGWTGTLRPCGPGCSAAKPRRASEMVAAAGATAAG